MDKTSVIIATKNEEDNIGNCLSSLQEQSYSNTEIIVVDNQSKDRTVSIAKKYTQEIYFLEKEVNLKNPDSNSKIKNFRGAQLNLGVKKAKGSIIFFPDADMTFDKHLIEEAVRRLNQFDALYIPEIIQGKGFFGKIRNFERSFYNATCIDGIRFVKKDLFLAVNGFDEKNMAFAPDDWDFTKRIKQQTNKITITSSPLYHHEEWLDLRTYLKKKQSYFNTFEGYINKWGINDPDIKKQLGLTYRMFGVFTENGKWKKLLTNPLLTASMLSIKFLVGANYKLRSVLR